MIMAANGKVANVTWDCPACGLRNHDPNVTEWTSFAGRIYRTVRAATAEERQELRSHLEKLKAESEVTPEQVAEVLRESNQPELASWVDRHAGQLAAAGAISAVLALLVAVLAWLWPNPLVEDGPTPETVQLEEITRQLEEIVHSTVAVDGAVPQVVASAAPAAQSLNSRCACGSGLKYKRCHGRPGGPREPLS